MLDCFTKLPGSAAQCLWGSIATLPVRRPLPRKGYESKGRFFIGQNPYRAHNLDLNPNLVNDNPIRCIKQKVAQGGATHLISTRIRAAQRIAPPPSAGTCRPSLSRRAPVDRAATMQFSSMQTRICNVPSTTHAPPPSRAQQSRVSATAPRHSAQHSRAACLVSPPLTGGSGRRCRSRAAALEARAAAPSNADLQEAENNSRVPGGDSFPEPFGGLQEATSPVPEAPSPVPVAPSAAAAAPAAVGLPTEQPSTDDGADAAAAGESESYMGLGELADVEELRGVRVKVDGNGKAIIEYLVHWKVSPIPVRPSPPCQA